MSWLIDPEEELVIVYFADRTLAVFATPGDPIPSPAFAQPFSVTVGQVFGWLEE